MIRKILFIFAVCVSLSAVSADEWGFAVWRYRYGHGSVSYYADFHNSQLCDFNTAQILAASKIPIYTPKSNLTDYRSTGNNSAVVTNIVTGAYFIDTPGYVLSAPLYCDIKHLVTSLCKSGLSPSNYCSRVFSDSTWTYYVDFETYPFLFNAISSPQYRDSVLSFLSSLDGGVSNILSHVIGISGDVSSLASYAPAVSSDLSAIRSDFDSLLPSVAPDWSVQSGLLNSQLFKGRYNSSMLPASLQNHFVSGLVLQPSDDIGKAYLNNWYNAFKNGTSDSFVDFWRMAGVSVSEDGEDYTYDSTANDLNFGNRTISLADYMGASPFQREAYKATFNKATNTNSVQRIGGDIKKSLGSATKQLGSISNSLDTLSRPQSQENQQKRQLDAEANAQAIKQALANNNNSLFNVHVNNWPDDGIKVNFDDQDLNIGFNASAGSAVSSIKDEIKNLVDDFRAWSGVEDGGNNLVIQDNIATNMGYIVGSLASLTNSYLSSTNTYPYGQYTAQQSTNDQNNARSYISSVQSELSRYNDFNAEDYISWGLSSYINPSERSDWNALRLMCINARLPEYITLVIPSFGSFGPWNLRVPTAPAVRIVSVSRFCCRMVYLFVLLWIACWAFRRYRDVLDILRDAFGLKGPMQMS